MAHAVVCPICNGEGIKIESRQIDHPGVPRITVKINNPCPKCGGRGWVEVSD